MSSIGFRGGFRITGGGNVQAMIFTGSRSNWGTAATLTLGFGGSASIDAGSEGQNLFPLDIPEFTIGPNCDTVHFFVATSDDNKTIRGTGTLYGRT